MWFRLEVDPPAASLPRPVALLAIGLAASARIRLRPAAGPPPASEGWSRCPGSNWRPRPYQGRALPTELHRPAFAPTHFAQALERGRLFALPASPSTAPADRSASRFTRCVDRASPHRPAEHLRVNE